MRKAFYLSKRGRIFYVQFRDPKTGAVLPAKSSGKTNRTRAEAWARSGLDLIQKTVPLIHGEFETHTPFPVFHAPIIRLLTCQST
jgi:hypothetical protein